ncbi:MAG: undecaprenyl-diphosphate phosphatase, partial [Wenzhouxiangella sp.]|nr:undecaprenyl-diphosphate phosphatase [Wenzhouxiangella sp.]
MDWIQAVLLALIQGLTEFLPVSSQAHLVLYSLVTGQTYQGIDFDIVLHAGSLVAVVLYFRAELIKMAGDWLRSVAGGPKTPDSKLAWWIILATIPAGVAGMLFKDQAEAALRSPMVMAAALIGFGLLLGWADWRHRGQRDEYSLGLKDVLIIGFAQALALIPGTSRSGITITAALFLGLNRESASRFSFLLSIPIIAAAGLLAALDLAESGFESGFGLLFMAFLAAAVSTYACIHYFLAFIKQ